MLRVLSHELRGPLGVMQGYLRLLLTRRADDAADVRMLTAILEASGRITAIARDASELATWQDGRAFEHRETIAARAMIEKAVGAIGATIEVSPAAADLSIETPNPGALSAAIGAVLQSRMRDLPNTPFVVGAGTVRPDLLTVVIGPAPAMAAGATTDDEHAAGERGAAAFTFDRGGQGLALLLAGVVLEGHGATVTLGTGDVLTLSLPIQRGTR